MGVTNDQLALLKARGFFPERYDKKKRDAGRNTTTKEKHRRELIARYNQMDFAEDYLETELARLFTQSEYTQNSSLVRTSEDMWKWIALRSARYRRFLAIERPNFSITSGKVERPRSTKEEWVIADNETISRNTATDEDLELVKQQMKNKRN